MKTLKKISVEILEELFNINIDNVFIQTDLAYRNFVLLTNKETIEKYKELIWDTKTKVWITKTKGWFDKKEVTRLKIKKA